MFALKDLYGKNKEEDMVCCGCVMKTLVVMTWHLEDKMLDIEEGEDSSINSCNVCFKKLRLKLSHPCIYLAMNAFPTNSVMRHKNLQP